MASLDEHILHLETQDPDDPEDGVLWWVDHPASCFVSGHTARQLEIMEGEGHRVPCDFWNLNPEDIPWRMDPRRPDGSYVARIDVDDSDPHNPHWYVATEPIPPEPEPEPEPTTGPYDPEPIRVHYGGRHLRSVSELRIAVLLDLLGVEWFYERRSFDLDGLHYLPDFFLPGGRFAPIIEVKAKSRVLALAEQLGMPKAKSGPMGDVSRSAISRVPFVLDTLPADIRKPAKLAAAAERDVWVIGGEPKSNQAWVCFHGDGTASANRRCPLFADHRLLDETHRLVRARMGKD